MKIKLRSESGATYFTTCITSKDLSSFVKMILETNQIYLYVYDDRERRGLLKFSTVESFMEVKEE